MNARCQFPRSVACIEIWRLTNPLELRRIPRCDTKDLSTSRSLSQLIGASRMKGEEEQTHHEFANIIR